MHGLLDPKPLILTENMHSTNKLVAAKAYIRAGLKLLATHGIDKTGSCTCGNSSCSHPGKHPIAKFFQRGALSATTDIRHIHKALAQFPQANLAATLDSLPVVDVDGPEGKELVKGFNFPNTIAVKTARGVHRYFSGKLARGSFKIPEIDVLTGPARYVMLPPSIHETGHRYRWLLSKTNQAADVGNAIDQLRPRPSQRHVPPNRKRIIRVGERNDVLFRTACALRRRIGHDDTIFEMMKIMNADLCEQPLQEDELKSVIQSSTRYEQMDEALFGPPEITRPLPMEFLWYPMVPRHGVTILAGDPGRGKSLLIALLVGIITGGRSWPLSSEKPTGHRVLLLSAEDNWARVTLHRLIKAGANLKNIHVMHKFRALTDERMESLAQEVESFRPDLVVIDTLHAYMGARDTHRQNEVGEFIAMLNEMAEATGCAIMVLGHLNKQSNQEPIYRIVGSIGFAASVRSALFLGRDPNDSHNLALAHGKHNGSVKGRTVLFKVEGGGRDDVPMLQPVGFSDATEHEVCQVEKNPVGRPNSENEDARNFVLEFLSEDEPLAWDRVRRAAEARSVASDGTLNKVRAELATEGLIVQIGKARKAVWKLAHKLAEPAEE